MTWILDLTWTALQSGTNKRGPHKLRMRCLPHTHLYQGILQSEQQIRSETGRQIPEINGQRVIRRVDELRAHPSYLRNGLAVSAAQLSALDELGDLAFQDPVPITPDGTVLDGNARVKLARLKERPTLSCIVYDLSEQEALRYLLQKHLRIEHLERFYPDIASTGP